MSKVRSTAVEPCRRGASLTQGRASCAYCWFLCPCWLVSLRVLSDASVRGARQGRGGGPLACSAAAKAALAASWLWWCCRCAPPPPPPAAASGGGGGVCAGVPPPGPCAPAGPEERQCCV